MEYDLLEKRVAKSSVPGLPPAKLNMAQVDEKFLDTMNIIRQSGGDLGFRMYGSMVLEPDGKIDEYLQQLEECYEGFKGVVANSELSSVQVIHFSSPLKYLEDIAQLERVREIARRGIY